MSESKPVSVRKSPRIPGYDYSRSNYYFVTICTDHKKCIFGDTNDLSGAGRIAYQDMLDLAEHFSGIEVDVFVIMPNHVHGILKLEKENFSLSSIIGGYKSGVARKIHEILPDVKVWQRSYHDHVIRDRTSYEKIYQYIQLNSQKWEDDCFYPKEKKH